MRYIKIYLEESNLVLEDIDIKSSLSPSAVVREKANGLFKFRDANKNYFFNNDSFDLTHITDGTGGAYTEEQFDQLFVSTIDLAPLVVAVENSSGLTLKAFSIEITRPSNITTYSAGDVVADVSAVFKPILAVSKAIGTGVRITRVRIQTEDTGVVGKKFNLHLYKEAPTFISDNSAFVLSYANASKRVGAIPILMGVGNLSTVGMNDYNQSILNPVARDIYWILETVDGFIPSANSTKFQITIDCELSNN